VSPGCYKCYAEALSRRNPATLGVWGARGTRVVAAESMWREPLKWDRQAKAAGVRRRVFCASLADVFEDWRGPMVDAKGRVLHYNSAATWWTPEANPHGPITMGFVRERLASVVRSCPSLDFLILTKRPEDAGAMLREMFEGAVPKNLWLGVSAEDQQRADQRIPILMSIPAAVRWVSAEPLLGQIDFRRLIYRGERIDSLDSIHNPAGPGLDWVVVGGESGPGRRPCEVAWIASIVDQCRAAGVACYVKQDAAPRDGQQGRFPDDLWAIKEFPQPDPIGA
jgi:protein gp37